MKHWASILSIGLAACSSNGGISATTPAPSAPAAKSGGAGAPAAAMAGVGGVATSAAPIAGSRSATGGAGSAADNTTVAAGMAVAMLEPLGAGKLSGTATFSKVTLGIGVKISVTGCTDGKSYPVHIHEGTSCADATSQGGHWGAEVAAAGSGGAGGAGQAGMSGAAGSGMGSGIESSGAGGGVTVGSGGTGGAAQAGSGGAGGAALAGAGGATPAAGSGGASGGTMTLKVRGEGIPDIMCSGGAGTTMHSRSTPDMRVSWTIGGAEATNVIGHVIVVHDGSERIACGKIMMQ